MAGAVIGLALYAIFLGVVMLILGLIYLRGVKVPWTDWIFPWLYIIVGVIFLILALL